VLSAALAAGRAPPIISIRPRRLRIPTDIGDDGGASFTMPNSGTWLLNVIWTKALPRSEETDFETVFSGLSFGFSSDHL
jgi:hypothetical protein